MQSTGHVQGNGSNNQPSAQFSVPKSKITVGKDDNGSFVTLPGQDKPLRVTSVALPSGKPPPSSISADQARSNFERNRTSSTNPIAASREKTEQGRIIDFFEERRYAKISVPWGEAEEYIDEKLSEKLRPTKNGSFTTKPDLFKTKYALTIKHTESPVLQGGASTVVVTVFAFTYSDFSDSGAIKYIRTECSEDVIRVAEVATDGQNQSFVNHLIFEEFMKKREEDANGSRLTAVISETTEDLDPQAQGRQDKSADTIVSEGTENQEPERRSTGFFGKFVKFLTD